jgi:hypothetical protein
VIGPTKGCREIGDSISLWYLGSSIRTSLNSFFNEAQRFGEQGCALECIPTVSPVDYSVTVILSATANLTQATNTINFRLAFPVMKEA